MRDVDQYIIDILRDIHPREMPLEALAELAGYSRTYLAKHVEALEEQGVLATRKTPDALYVSFKKE